MAGHSVLAYHTGDRATGARIKPKCKDIGIIFTGANAAVHVQCNVHSSARESGRVFFKFFGVHHHKKEWSCKLPAGSGYLLGPGHTD